MDLGSRVRETRDRLRLSRERLIERMGDLRMDRNTLWHIEAGRTKNPRADQLMGLGKALNVSIDYLLGLTDDPPPPSCRRRKRPAPGAEPDALDVQPAPRATRPREDAPE